MLRRTALALLICLAAPGTALADSSPWGLAQVLKERYHRPSESDDDIHVVYALADSTEDGAVPVARGLPWGFNRGTCDRERIVRAAGDALPGVDGSDRDCVVGALEMLPDQRQIAWTGESGEQFRVVPERSYRSAGLLCRDYSAQIQANGRRQQTFGTACRRPDGQWEVLD